MFKTILAPLDGSKLAECALTYAETLTRSCAGSEVILVSVTERVEVYTRAPEAREAFLRSDDPRLAQSAASVVITLGKKQSPAQRYLSKVGRKLQVKRNTREKRGSYRSSR